MTNLFLRSRFFSIHFELSDLSRHSLGSLSGPVLQNTVAYSALSKTTISLSAGEVDFLSGIGEEWSSLSDKYVCDVDSMSRLVKFGFVFRKNERGLSDAALYSIEQNATKIGWERHAFIFFRRSNWADMHLSVGDYGKLDSNGLIARNDDDPRIVLDKKDSAPPEVFSFGYSDSAKALPSADTLSPLDRVFAERRSRRAYTKEPISLVHFATILKATFGAVSRVRKRSNLTVLRKTSPSGGSMHGTECLVFVLNVAGLEEGLYHYKSDNHTLAKAVMSPSGGMLLDAVQEVAAGQYFVRSAGAVVVFVTRFDRLFWKYFDHDRALAVSWLDIGHLSQTCLLKACELNVGATFSAALSEENANRVCDLDGVTQSARAFVALGVTPDQFQENLETEIQSADSISD